ncbi:FAD-dependent oxidoreductase [Eubacteriaceae bacterium ES2]|nr:FAD-dependent oxidoreductase [Eubacteriaceae bacterium ES2]
MYEKLCQLANMIDGNSPEFNGNRTPDDAGVRLLASVIDDHEAEIAMMYPTVLTTVDEAAAGAGVDPETIREATAIIAQKGVLFCGQVDGVMKYRRVPWAPGICEYLILNKPSQGPQVANAFIDYTRDIVSIIGANFTIGRGNLRTIPIGKAIKAESTTASYEELKTYLDQSTVFSKADCACRLAQRIVGTPCEHPVEDMCIQVGHEAEYYIRTGRATQITREEAEDIILKAERLGLVHQIFNNEGMNQSTFICNCCGCSCASLRAVSLFKIADANRSNFVAEVDPEKCVGCGSCVENCNTNALALGSAFCKDNQAPVYEVLPGDTDWTEEYWDLDFRKRRMVNGYGTAPCKTTCPAHISVQGYIKKAHEGKYDEALQLIKRDNPFPAICGRVCPHNCENECTRNVLDEAIAIDDIKKYIADKELDEKNRFIPEIHEKFDEKIAIIGAGPAGLSCAYYALLSGYQVTVFEKHEKLGGMMTRGIPEFRLENDIIDAEIDVMRQMGVEFKTGLEVGKDITINALRDQGYKAFFIGIGAQAGRKLNIEGEDLDGIELGVEFLSKVALDKNRKLTGKTVVIGGGNVAIDVARTSVRLGSDDTELYCLETREEMPALAEEQHEAQEEGVSINNSWAPKAIIGENGKVKAVEFMRCVSVFDENKRFSPKYDESEIITVPCSNVLISVGQSIVWGDLLKDTNVQISERNTLIVDEMTLQSRESDLFAGGDAITGPKFVIDAIAAGKSGATSIHRFLRGYGMKVRREREYKSLDKANLDLAGYDQLPREKAKEINFTESKNTFKDLRSDLTDQQIMKETNRCLGCGISIVDEYQCIGCGVCATKCEFDAIKLKRKYDVASAETTEQWGIDFVTYSREREKRIAAKQSKLGE